MLLTSSPYIEFNPNKYTDPLIQNWEKIRNEFWYSCKEEKLLDETGWIDNEKALKPNGDTSAHFPGVLYDGIFKSSCLMIRENMLDSREKEALKWEKDEKVRWWIKRMGRMPFLSNYAIENEGILAGMTFNTMMPGSILNFHWGLDSKYIRIHLCLDSASGCIFNIEGYEREWINGELFGFDDCDVLHGTKHTGSKPRTILLLDIEKEILKPYAKIWPCRGYRPAKGYWNMIKESCSVIKHG